MAYTSLSDTFSLNAATNSEVMAGYAGCGWLPQLYARALGSVVTISGSIVSMGAGASSVSYLIYYYESSQYLDFTNATVKLTGVNLNGSTLMLKLDTNTGGQGTGVVGTLNGSTVSWNVPTVFSFQLPYLNTIIRVRFYNGGSNTITFTGLTTALACFAKGMLLTKVITMIGNSCDEFNEEVEVETPVEDLCIGNVLRTRDGFTEVINVTRSEHPPSKDALSYIIPKNHYGMGRPSCDTLLSPKHSIFTPARHWKHMQHSEFEQKPSTDTVVYYHVQTSSYIDDVIYVNGMETETWDRVNQNQGWDCEGGVCRRHCDM